MTADEDFVIDRIGPIAVVGGCSGHAFKFTPLIGEALADMATGKEPNLPMARFSATRASLAAPFAV
jgi:sarcosine oxidase